MLKIRLQRVGRKHEPVFRVVLVDSKRGPKSGNVIEVLGSYDSRTKGEIKFDSDRITYWISMGAQVSDTLHNLFVTKGVIKGKKKNVLPKKSPIKKENGEQITENRETKTEVKIEEKGEVKEEVTA